ncbi:MAG: CBS domain-containing protein [Candidatus Aenigmarchaeota archaeon]|nr:CBS domain-containing protein [Candidatus Aenigmarchaeota archaeon]
MIVKDIMQTDIEKVDASVNVKEAARRMSAKKIGCLLVVEDHKLLGIVTEDDIIKKVVVEGKTPHSITVAEIMEREVVRISPDETIETAAEIMTQKKIKKLPVVGGKKLLGIITATDMVAAEPRMMEHLGELLLFAKKPQRIAG